MRVPCAFNQLHCALCVYLIFSCACTHVILLYAPPSVLMCAPSAYGCTQCVHMFKLYPVLRSQCLRVHPVRSCVYPVRFYGCRYACTPCVLHDIQPCILSHEPPCRTKCSTCCFLLCLHNTHSSRTLAPSNPKRSHFFFAFCSEEFWAKDAIFFFSKIYDHLSHGMEFKPQINPQIVKAKPNHLHLMLPQMWVIPNLSHGSLYAHSKCILRLLF